MQLAKYAKRRTVQVQAAASVGKTGNILLNIILSDKTQFVQRGNNVQVSVDTSGI